MCELFCLSSRLPTRATFTLRTFASHGALGGAAVDGWGIAFYDGRAVRLYKEPEPAGDSAWLAFIEGRRLAGRLVLSHIRRATTGAISFANTQPFVRELGGRMHVFAHNGRLDGIETQYGSAPQRFRPVGDTDSEAAFCIILERLAPLWSAGTTPALADRLDIIARFAAEMRRLGQRTSYTPMATLFSRTGIDELKPTDNRTARLVVAAPRVRGRSGRIAQWGVTIETGRGSGNRVACERSTDQREMAPSCRRRGGCRQRRSRSNVARLIAVCPERRTFRASSRLWRGSLVAPIVMHFLQDFLSIVLLPLLGLK